MRRLKIKLVFVFILSINALVYGQDCSNVQLEQYIIDKYSSIPVEGAKYIYLKGCKYVIGIGIVPSGSSNMSTTNRVASIKARRSVIQLLNNPKITSEQIYVAEENSNNNSVSYTEYFQDKVTEEAAGFVNDMELLSAFYTEDKKTFIYVIYKKV